MNRRPSSVPRGLAYLPGILLMAMLPFSGAVQAIEIAQTSNAEALAASSVPDLPVALMDDSPVKDGTHSGFFAEGSAPPTLILAKAGGGPGLAAKRLNDWNQRITTIDLDPADHLLAQGGVKKIGRALDLYRKAAELEPENFEVIWKCARALFLYSQAAERDGLENWKAFCRVYGKEGVQYGEKAIALQPERVEGYLYYGSCVWKYAQGVGHMQSFRKNLKGKAQKAMERAYSIDKTFDTGWPMKALGIFWYNLPWPLRDYENSLTYLEEYHKSFPDDDEGRYYLAQALLKLNREEEAQALLKEVEKSMLVLQQAGEGSP